MTVTAGLASFAASPASATAVVKVNRVSGPTRYETAAAIAENKYPSGVPNGNVVLATGMNFPDALAGNYLAGQLGAPIMLTPTTSTDPEFATTTGALAKLLPGTKKNVIILGGTDAVSAGVASALTSAGYNVTRIGGLTRYDTAQMVDTQSGQTSGAGVSGNKTALVATGENFPDALASGPLAWAKHFPIVLTNGTQSTLSPQAQATLTADGIKNVLIMGGSAAISPGINSALTGMGITIDKQFSGADRTDTAAQLATYEIANYGFTNTSVILASGGNFPDALAAGPWGGDPQPIVLTEPDLTLGQFTTSFLKGESATLSTINVAGGSAAVPDATVNAAVAAAQSAPTAPTSLPSLVAASILKTTTVGQSNGSNPPGTVIQYVFSQNLSSAIISAAGFHAFDATDARYAASSAVLDATNPNAVDVLFQATAPNNLQTTAGAATLTLATVSGAGSVSGPAVTVGTSSNPDGAAAIGSSSSSTIAAGVTAAPNPESWTVTQTGGGAAPNTTPVNITFDKAAVTQSGAGAGFNIVLASTPTSGNAELTCTGPVNTDTTDASGGTIAGGNGTSTITVICPDITPATPITAAQIARVVVQPGAVGTAAATNTNPLEAADAPHLSGTAVDSPTLTSVTVIPGTSSTGDQIVWQFDRPVGAVVPADFTWYDANGGTHSTFSAGPAVNPQNSTQVVATVGTVANGTLGIAGASIIRGAVTGLNAPGHISYDDEMGAVNPSNSTTTTGPGVVNAPQLKSVKAVATTNVTGSSLVVTYTFSQPVSVGPVGAAGLHLYDADGTELTCSSIASPTFGGTSSSQFNNVTCNNFVQGTVSGSSPQATASQIAGIVLGTADYQTVVGNVGNGSPSAGPNPEGAVPAGF